MVSANLIEQSQEGATLYRPDPDWPKYPPEISFEMGSGIAVDDRDIIYALAREVEHWTAHPLALSTRQGKGSVMMFDRDGNYLGKWGKSDEPGFALTAHTIHFIDGNFWITDREGHTVRKFDREGNLLLTLGTFAEWGADERHFNGPTGVAVQKNGNIVVTDGYWNARLIWFSPEGEYIKEIGGWGYGPGQFILPHAVTQLPDGRLLVVDGSNGALHRYATVEGQIAEHRKHNDPKFTGRIVLLDADGNFLEEWTHFRPLSVTVIGDRIFASDQMSDLVILDAATLKEIGRQDNLVPYIHQLAMDSHGDIYTACVYTEHAGVGRGTASPSFRKWISVAR